MVKLKKQSVHKAICPTCKGNGFLQIKDQEDPAETNVHQCWDCDSEGEFYVYQPKTYESNNTTHIDADNDDKLH